MDKIIVLQPVGWTDIVDVGLVGMLVLITFFYAKRTRDMVQEMREARRAQLMPKLKLSIRNAGQMRCVVKIINLGAGAAINIQLELWFGNDFENRRPWTAPLLTSGEDAQFFSPGTGRHGMPTNDQFSKEWKTISIKATYYDVFDQLHEIEETLDFADYWEKSKAAQKLYTVDALGTIGKHLEHIAEKLETLK